MVLHYIVRFAYIEQALGPTGHSKTMACIPASPTCEIDRIHTRVLGRDFLPLAHASNGTCLSYLALGVQHNISCAFHH